MALMLVSTNVPTIAETIANQILQSPRAVIGVQVKFIRDEAEADNQDDNQADDQQADNQADDQQADNQANGQADNQQADNQANGQADDQQANNQADDQQADNQADNQQAVDMEGRDIVGVRNEERLDADDARFRKGIVVAVLLLLAVGVILVQLLGGITNLEIDRVLSEQIRAGDLVSGSAAKLRSVRTIILNEIQAKGISR